MKKCVSIMLCFAILLCTIPTLAGTYEMPVNYTKDFTDAEDGYNPESDGWVSWSSNKTEFGITDNKATLYKNGSANSNGLLVVGNGGRMFYNQNLGENFSVSGRFYNQQNGVRVYFHTVLEGNAVKSGFYLTFATVSMPVTLSYKPDSGADIVLMQWGPFAAGIGGPYKSSDFSVEYNGGILHASASCRDISWDSEAIDLFALMDEKNISGYPKDGVFGLYDDNSPSLTLNKVTISGVRQIETNPMSIIPLSPKNGIGTDESIKLKFSSEVSDEAFLSAMTVTSETSNPVIKSVMLADDKKTVCVAIDGLEDGSEYTLTIPKTFTGVYGDYLTDDYLFHFAVSNTPAQSIALYDQTGECALYKEKGFEDSFTFTGALNASGEDYIFFNSNEDIDGNITGARIAVYSGDNPAVCLQVRNSSAEMWRTVKSYRSYIKLNERVDFNLTYHKGSVEFYAAGSGYAALTGEISGLNYGFAGVCGDFSNLVVRTEEDNTYASVSVVFASAPFSGYAVYKEGTEPEISLTLNADTRDISSVFLFIDGQHKIAMTGEGNVFSAKMPALSRGGHSATAVITDARGLTYTMKAEGIWVGDDTFVADAFECDGQRIFSVEEALGKTVTARFNSLTDKDVVTVICLYNKNGELVDAAFGNDGSSGDSASLYVPQNEENCCIKAFVCRSLTFSAPLSGVMTLK